MFKDTLDRKNQVHSLNIENRLVDLSRCHFNEIENEILSDATQQINFYWLA